MSCQLGTVCSSTAGKRDSIVIRPGTVLKVCIWCQPPGTKEGRKGNRQAGSKESGC